MSEPQVLTLTAWALSPSIIEELAARHGVETQRDPLAIMAMHSVNMKTTTLCHMGAFILRELGKNLGLEKASELVLQTAMTLTMRSQFKTGPNVPPPYDPAQDFGDERPWTEADFEEDPDDDYNDWERPPRY